MSEFTEDDLVDNPFTDNLAVQLAVDVLNMRRRIEHLERENAILAGYQKKYQDLLSDSVKNSGEMIGTMLKATLDGVFTKKG